MNQFFDWMQQWQQQANQAMPFFSPFAHNATPQANFMSMMQNPMQHWQAQQKNIFANFMPHNDLLAFWESVSRYNLNNASFQDMFVTPYLDQLEQAYKTNDSEAQKETIRSLCHHWLERSNFVLNKHLDTIIWQKDALKLFYEQTRWEMIQPEYQQDVRDYCLALIASYEELINIMRVFDGFESALTDRFLEKTLSMDVEIQDVEQLFSMWCDLFDEYYTECTFSTAYRTHFAAFISAVSKCRAGQQMLVDKSVEFCGLPSKREMDSVHKRIQQQQKALRQLSGAATKDSSGSLDTLEQTVQAQQATIEELQGHIGDIEQIAKEVAKLQHEIVKKDTAINKLSADIVSAEKRLKTLISATSTSKKTSKTTKADASDKTAGAKGA